jgi:hypothetical protein
MRRQEELLQIQIKQYHEYSKNGLSKKTKLNSVRNENNQGGWRGARKGKIYNDMGRLAGYFDLQLAVEGGKMILIELKSADRCITSTGKLTKSLGLSDVQKEVHKEYKELGFETHVIWSLEQFETILKNI